MMNHPEAVNVIEAIVSKGKALLSIGHFKSAGDAEEAKPLGCELYRLWRQIHPSIPCSVLCELETIRAYTTPDFQDVFPAKRGKPSHCRYMPLPTLITFSGNVVEISPAIIFRR